MTAIDLGTTASVSWPQGTTGLTITLAVTKPDGTALSPAPTVTDTAGVYSAPVPCATAGRHLLTWTKAAAPALKYTDVIDVWPADPRFIISIDEALTAIRVSNRVTGGVTFSDPDRSDMRLFIAAATPVIEDIVGPVLIATKTKKASGGRAAILLTPKLDSITSVVVDGTTLVAGTGYTVDENAGILYAGAWPGALFPPGLMNILITYVVGSSSITPNVRTATAALVRRMWQRLMNAQHGYLNDDTAEETVTTQSGYVVPLEVWQLCRPDRRISGVG